MGKKTLQKETIKDCWEYSRFHGNGFGWYRDKRAIHITEIKIDISKRISDHLLVYTAEIVAVIIALKWVEEVKPDRVIVCTDSLAVIKSIQSKTSVREVNDRTLSHFIKNS